MNKQQDKNNLFFKFDIIQGINKIVQRHCKNGKNKTIDVLMIISHALENLDLL